MRVFLILMLLALVGCTTKKPLPPKPEPIQVVDDEPIVVTPTDDLRKDIYNIVEGSSCAKYRWKDRRVAYPEYMKGMAVMYAKQICGQGTDFIKPEKVSGGYKLYSGTYAYKDSLDYYGIKGSELETYTFLIGLGMRESSGRYCTGRDMSANYTASQDAESGLFQMAYVARVFNSELDPLYKKYKAGELSCELDLFKSSEIDTACNKADAKIYGSGEGAAWQQLMKRCPAASTQWAAILIRSQYRHFGPVIRKEVEVLPQCRQMLQDVEKAVSGRCSQL